MAKAKTSAKSVKTSAKVASVEAAPVATSAKKASSKKATGMPSVKSLVMDAVHIADLADDVAPKATLKTATSKKAAAKTAVKAPASTSAKKVAKPAAKAAKLPKTVGRKTWATVKEYEDIKLEVTADGVAKITINRPEVRNAFRPQTVEELLNAFELCRDEPDVGAVILTGEGDLAFCSGGDQRVRGEGGYVGKDGVPRLNVLDLQKAIRSLPKPVVAMVAGYAVGGGHVLHVVCDLTIAADNAKFGQTGPKVGSFDGGLGSSYLARIVGQKKAREIWYLCRIYDAQQALEMGLVNTVVPLADLETETLKWCREMLAHSPIALRCLKAALNADCDGQIGLLDLAGNATLLYYMSEEGKEGKNAYLQKRKPDFKKFGRLP